MNKLKYHFLGGLVFLGTIVFGYIGYTAYTNLATQVDGATITKDIWNDVVNTVNSIGTDVNTLKTNSSYQIGVGQTRQNVTSSRVSGTNYTNNTGKPILVNISLNSGASGVVNYLYIDGINVASVRNDGNAAGIFGTMTAIVPNGSTYYATLPGIINTWTELR